MKKVLITGSTGMLGSDFVRTLCTDTQYDVYGLGRSLNVALPASKQFLIDLSKPFYSDLVDIQPDVIIHAAAITDLNLCERNPSLANQVHVEASRSLAELLDERGTFFYISTDSVFDGIRGNYSESDLPNPLNIYALTKLKGEAAVETENRGKTTIVRTNIYGFHYPLKNSLAEWAYQEWISGKKISGFTDTIFNAVYTHQLVGIVKFLMVKDMTCPILNVGSSEAVSKFDFLQKFATALKIDPSLLASAMSDDFPSAIKRPKDTSLDTSLLSTLYKVPEFEDGVQNLVSQLNGVRA